jgi:hypothetical protein
VSAPRKRGIIYVLLFMNILLHILVFFLITKISQAFFRRRREGRIFHSEAKPKAIGHSLQLNGTVVTRVQ